MSTPNEPEKKPSESGSGQIVPPWQRGVTDTTTGGGGGSQTVTTPVSKPDQSKPDQSGPGSSAGASPAPSTAKTETVSKPEAAKPAGDGPTNGTQAPGPVAGIKQPAQQPAVQKPAPPRNLVSGTAAPKIGGGSAPPKQVPEPSEASPKAKRDAAAAKAALSGDDTAAPRKFKESPTRHIPRESLPQESLPDLDAIHNVDEDRQPVATPVRSAPARIGTGRPLRAAMQLRSVDPWSVFKIGAVLSFVGFVIWMIAIALLFLVLQGMGVWDQINSSFGTLVTADGGTGSGEIIGVGAVFGWGALLGAVSAVLLTAIATVGSYIYNICADMVGGVEVTLADLD